MPGCAAVVHLAAIPGEAPIADIAASHVVGTDRVLAAAVRHGVDPRRARQQQPRGRLHPARRAGRHRRATTAGHATTAWARWRRRRSGRCTTTGTGWRWPRCGSGRSATVRCPGGTCRPGCRRTTCAGSSTPRCARRTSASRSCTASRRTPGGGGTWHPAQALGYHPPRRRGGVRGAGARRDAGPDARRPGRGLPRRLARGARAGDGSGPDPSAPVQHRPPRRPVRSPATCSRAPGRGPTRTPTATPATSSRRCSSPTRSRSWPTGSTDGWSSAPPGCAARSAPARTG